MINLFTNNVRENLYQRCVSLIFLAAKVVREIINVQQKLENCQKIMAKKVQQDVFLALKGNKSNLCQQEQY